MKKQKVHRTDKDSYLPSWLNSQQLIDPSWPLASVSGPWDLQNNMENYNNKVLYIFNMIRSTRIQHFHMLSKKKNTALPTTSILTATV